MHNKRVVFHQTGALSFGHELSARHECRRSYGWEENTPHGYSHGGALFTSVHLCQRDPACDGTQSQDYIMRYRTWAQQHGLLDPQCPLPSLEEMQELLARTLP